MVLGFAAARLFPSVGKDTAYGRGKRQSADDGDSRGEPAAAATAAFHTAKPTVE